MIYGSIKHGYNGRKIKKRAVKGEVYGKYTTPSFKPLTAAAVPTYADIRMAESDRYRSVNVKVSDGICSKSDKKQYTGTLVKGISTMHKSNAVPIINEQEAKDHASMRR
jgi:hypothetical protein